MIRNKETRSRHSTLQSHHGHKYININPYVLILRRTSETKSKNDEESLVWCLISKVIFRRSCSVNINIYLGLLFIFFDASGVRCQCSCVCLVRIYKYMLLQTMSVSYLWTVLTHLICCRPTQPVCLYV